MKKIFVPEGYGRQEKPGIVDLMAYGDNAAQVLALRADMERQVQNTGTELGLEFAETVDFPDAVGDEEFTARGGSTTDLDEMRLIGTIDPTIKIPRVELFDEFDQNPHFPVVAKPHLLMGTPWHTTQGDKKFLIETPEQWRRFRAFLMSSELPFPPDSKWEGYQAVSNSARLGKDAFYFQDFVETPSDRYTSVRVMVTATGHILASSLLYSSGRKGEEALLASDSEDYCPAPGEDMTVFLTLPNSPVFLGAKAIFSNRHMGGGGIVLSPTVSSKPASDSEKTILREHGFDSESPILPEELARASSSIAQKFGKKKGLVVGIDWIRGKDGTWHYLETNVQPGVKTYVDANMRGEGNEAEAMLEIYKTALRDIAGL